MEDALCPMIKHAGIKQPTGVSQLPQLEQPADEVHEASTPACCEHDAQPNAPQQHENSSQLIANVQPGPEEGGAAINSAYGLAVDVKSIQDPMYSAGALSDTAQDTTVAAVPMVRAMASTEHVGSQAATYGSTLPSRPDADLSSPSSGQVATTLQTDFVQHTSSDMATVPEQQHGPQQPQEQAQPLQLQHPHEDQHLQAAEHQQETELTVDPEADVQQGQDDADVTAAAVQQSADDNHGAALALALLGQAAVLPQSLSVATFSADHSGLLSVPADGRHAGLIDGDATNPMGYGYSGFAAQLLHSKADGAGCQVPGCIANLNGAGVSTYFRRHRVCATHAKSDSVNINDVLMRFCQQCGVMHALAEFDGARKSCRVQLDRHNLRRRCRRKTQIAKTARKQYMESSSRGPGSSMSPSGAWATGAALSSPPRGAKGNRATARAAAAAFAAAAESGSAVTGDSSREQEAEGYCYGDADYLGQMGYGMMGGMMYDQGELDPSAAAAAVTGGATYPAGYHQPQQQQQQAGKYSRGIKKLTSSSNMWEQQGVGYPNGHEYQMASMAMESYGNACGVQQQHMGQHHQLDYQQQQQQENYQQQQEQAMQWLPASTWPAEPPSTAAAAAAAPAGIAAGAGSITAAEVSAAKPAGLPTDISLQELRLLIANAISHGQGPGITAIRGLGFVQQMLLVDELATGVVAELEKEGAAAAASAQGNSAVAPSPRQLSAAAAAEPTSPAAAAGATTPQQLLSLMQQLVKSTGGAGNTWSQGTAGAWSQGQRAGATARQETADYQHQQQHSGRKRPRASSEHHGKGGALFGDDPAATAAAAENLPRGNETLAAVSAAGLEGNLLRQLMLLATTGGNANGAAVAGSQHVHESSNAMMQGHDQEGEVVCQPDFDSVKNLRGRQPTDGDKAGGGGGVKGAALAAAAALLAAAGIRSGAAGSDQANALIKMLMSNQEHRGGEGGERTAAAAAAAAALSPRLTSGIATSWMNTHDSSPASVAPGAGRAASVATAATKAAQDSSNPVVMSAALLKALSVAADRTAAEGKIVRGSEGNGGPCDRTAMLLSSLLQQLSGAKQ